VSGLTSQHAHAPLPDTGGLAVQCAAKINFFLDCGTRRADGYHALQSVMQRIDVYDILHVAVAPGGVCDAAIRSGTVRATRRTILSAAQHAH